MNEFLTILKLGFSFFLAILFISWIVGFYRKIVEIILETIKRIFMKIINYFKKCSAKRE